MKYTVKVLIPNDPIPSKYKVKVKETVTYEHKYVLKEHTQGLHSWVYDKKPCTALDTGNGLEVKIEDISFDLDYCQVEYLRAILNVWAKHHNYVTTIKEKTNG